MSSTIANFATFLGLSFAAVFSIVGLSGSERNTLLQTRASVAEVRLAESELSRDLLIFLNTSIQEQDTLAAACQHLQSAADRLECSIESLSPKQSSVRSSVGMVLESCAETVARVERLRSLEAVLRNAMLNLPRLISQAESRARQFGISSELADELNELDEAISLLDNDPEEFASERALEIYDRIETLKQAYGDVELGNLVRLTLAQTRKVIDYKSFLSSDADYLQACDAVSTIAMTQGELAAVLTEAERQEAWFEGVLTVASTGLIAFVAVGIFRFAKQSQQLKRLNYNLEEMVLERTHELEEARRQAEAQFVAMDRFQGRVEFSPDGVILDVNEGFAATMGYEPEELRGIAHSTLVSNTIAESDGYADFWAELRSGNFHLGEFERIASDGSKRWIHATYNPIVDEAGRVQKIVKYATDRTDQKHSEEEAAEAQRRLSDLARVIRESPNELYIFDAVSLHFVEVNQGAINSIGYSQEELEGLTPIDIKPAFDEDSFRAAISPLINGERTRLEFQTNHRRKDGSEYPAQIMLHMASYAGREVFVAFVTDLTEPQRLEQQLAQAQKLESIGQLAAGVAHEINTPMQFVGDNLEYLSQCSVKLMRVMDKYETLLVGQDALTWDERRERMQQLSKECRIERIRAQMPAAIEESREGVRRIVSIIRAMKEFSHPGAKQRMPCNLNDMISSTVAISRNRWKYCAELELQLDPNLPDAPLLSSEINQVLLNLIVNAGDAIAERILQDNQTTGLISVRTFHDRDSVAVEVKDNGCGITDEVREKIFDPFFTTKEVGKGTGQGLSITHNAVVKLHGGSVHVESKVGVGSVFTITLPRTEIDEAQLSETHLLESLAT